MAEEFASIDTLPIIETLPLLIHSHNKSFWSYFTSFVLIRHDVRTEFVDISCDEENLANIVDASRLHI